MKNKLLKTIKDNDENNFWGKLKECADDYHYHKQAMIDNRPYSHEILDLKVMKNIIKSHITQSRITELKALVEMIENQSAINEGYAKGDRFMRGYERCKNDIAQILKDAILQITIN